jgi:uncharacterized protein (DUF427 family)
MTGRAYGRGMHPVRIEPAPGQESVWDYPRPPRLERTSRRLRVILAGEVVADTRRGWRACETAGAPVYYLPPEDVRTALLRPSGSRSFCEWKGRAVYYDVVLGDVVRRAAAWAYPDPTAAFAPIAGHLAFYAGSMDLCTVAGERVRPQPGGFYGGWITAEVVGPFKGEPGTERW